MSTSADEALFRAEGLRVRLTSGTGREILSDAGFSVRRGAFTGLIGETGSGKSVTLRAALEMLPRELALVEGSSWFDGRRVQDLGSRELRRLRGESIGFVPQQPWGALNPVQAIGRQFADVARSHGRSSSWARQRSGEVLERVGIPDVERVRRGYVGELSGGMAQRVLIAMAIMLSPRLIVADEPTTALDVTVQRDILELIRSICREDSLGVLVVTHDLGVVSTFCDDVFVMNDGRVLESGPVRSVFAQPAHEYTAELLGASTRHVRADDFSVRTRSSQEEDHRG